MPRGRMLVQLLLVGLIFAVTTGTRLSCSGASSLPETKGSIGVRIETTGVLIPPAGFLVHVGTLTERITPFGGFHSFQNLDVGQYQVTVDLPFNCMVVGVNPRAATVTAANTTQVTFNVECLADAGSVRVVTVTNGPMVDPDGYVVNVGTLSQAVPLNGAVTFTGVSPGMYNVLLTSVHASCMIVGANPRPVDVTFNTTTNVEFVVDCTGTNGTLRVRTQTTGQDVDGDGYIVNALGQQIVFSNNFSYDFVSVPAGNHQVQLINVASNCVVAGSNPRTVTIQASVTTETTFDVTCSAIPVFLFESEESGNREVVSMKADGSARTEITSDPALDGDPSWSWDATKIVFASERGGARKIWVMNADGSNPTPVTTGGAQDGDPAWSPDGTKIVFERESTGQFVQIWIVDANGQNPTELTTLPGESEDPKFSPDGSRILFYSNRNGSSDIYTMLPDGNGVTRLTFDTTHEYDPAWSPDGTQIVFSSDRNGSDDLYVMDANGQNVMRLTSAPGDEYAPSWSADGQYIAFTSDRNGDEDIFVINADGTNERLLTGNTAKDDDPDFKPGN